MYRILVLGAGKIGALISAMLASSDDFNVYLADRDLRLAEQAPSHPRITPVELDAAEPKALGAWLADHPADAVISSLPYYLNVQVARAARRAGTHYFDLTEDIAVTREVRRIAAHTPMSFAPQCGLAPGFISIVANELMGHFDEPRVVKLRVGALPQHPNNVLKYSLNWSTEGLINEYANVGQAIIDGVISEVLPLEGREEIEIDGTSYEAFNTSGGLGSLAETHAGRVERMDYKTMRYPGHCEQMRLLLNGLKLRNDRDTLKRILENAVPQTLQDVVVIYASVEGLQEGRLREENYVNKVYPQVIAGRLWSAIQVTTAAGVCSVVDLILADPAAYQGFVAMERFGLKDIVDNRFGRHFAQGGSSALSARLVAAGATRDPDAVDDTRASISLEGAGHA
ncbi:MAG: saccharopine dehydrogenase NADP-binding domain-containing protein [Gammaproteobacteria bacterium]|nr:saccharopine dehydrogenase NADP-binding domain-containing protein [Gammaproteobacteria bacterium]